MTSITVSGTEIYYDGKEQALRNLNGTLRVDEPQKGVKIRFGLENKTNEKLGVVLRINGINTLQMEGADKQIEECSRWVLSPKGRYETDGFRVEKDKKMPFVGATSGEPLRQDLPAPGLIEVAVFREDPNAAAMGRGFISLRRLASPDVQAKDLERLQLKLLPLSSGKRSMRGVIVASDAQQTNALEEKALDRPKYAGLLSIRYLPARGK